jgi:hypothetical protein
MTEADVVLDLIKEKGFGGLGYLDGCICCSFALKGIKIDISCRKSGGSDQKPYGPMLRVWSNSMECDPDGMVKVASELVSQMKVYTNSLVKVRFCSYTTDKNNSCSYCGAPRENADKYLCNECYKKKDDWNGGTLASTHEYSEIAADLIKAAMEETAE